MKTKLTVNNCNKSLTIFVDNLVTIGKIGKPFGINGWLNLINYAENNDLFSKQLILNRGKHFKSTKLDDILEFNQSYTKVKIKNINDRDEASLYTHSTICIERKNLPSLKEDIFYWYDLILCNVYIKHKLLGIVDNITDNGQYDSINIRVNNQYISIPFIFDKFIKNVDIINKIITLNEDLLLDSIIDTNGKFTC